MDFVFERLAVAVAALSLTLALAVMAAQVVFRYFLGDSLVWAEEVARYSLVWSSMTGAAVAYRQGGHVAIVNLVTRLPAGPRIAVVRLVHLLILCFSALLGWSGWLLAMRNFARQQMSVALEIEIAWIYLAIPLAALLMMAAAIEAIATARKPEEGVTAL